MQTNVLQELGMDKESVGETMGVDPKCAVERDHHDGDEAIEDVGRGVDGGDVVAGVEGVGENHA